MQLSVIIPTFNEADNIIPLVIAVDKALSGIEYEIVFADDSTDRTTEIIRHASIANSQIQLRHRQSGRGLASAIVEAIPTTSANVLAVLDGDLQHPPSILPYLLDTISRGADLAVASRYAPGGWDSGLAGFHRRLASKATRLAAYLLLPSSKVTTDPLSGYFVFKKSILEHSALRPLGYKILLEILVRGNARKVVDVPFTFDRRVAEKSKAGLGEAWRYIRHLWHLRG